MGGGGVTKKHVFKTIGGWGPFGSRSGWEEKCGDEGFFFFGFHYRVEKCGGGGGGYQTAWFQQH